MITGDFDGLELALRRALDEEAEQIEPSDRRGEILTAVHARAGGSSSRRRWLVPVAAAASVAIVSGGLYGLAHQPDHQLPPPAVATRVTSTPSTSSTSTPATVRKALPAYFVGPVAGHGSGFGLFRQFVGSAVPRDATPDQLGRAALETAMRPPASGTADYLDPWHGVRVTRVTVTPDRIDVELSGPGSARGLSGEQTRLAVQQLVWTVQAGIGQGNTPVWFAIADGSTSLFGRYPIARSYDRPAKITEHVDLAPLWITDPSPGQVVAGDSPLVANGQACTVEAGLRWQLRHGTTVVDSGSTTATSACPARGAWRIDLGRLPAGDYTLRVFTTSAADGTTVTAQVSSHFTVR